MEFLIRESSCQRRAPHPNATPLELYYKGLGHIIEGWALDIEGLKDLIVLVGLNDRGVVVHLTCEHFDRSRGDNVPDYTIELYDDWRE